jgi:3-hydroxybutyryl-CoA dehydrogenase
MVSDQIHTIAIVGAGVMGQGIAQLCATFGFNVQLLDLQVGAASKAKAIIGDHLKTLSDKGKLGEEPQGILSRIVPIKGIEDIAADIVIEAIVEQLEPKRNLFAAIEKVNPDAIMATNTSTFPVNDVASKMKRPGSVVGIHFFNPAPLMKLVEVIAGKETSTETLHIAKAFAETLGKTTVLVKDSPGFIVNRVARPFYVESLKLLEDKAGSHETIDKLLKTTGFRMGPFELMDVIGVDTNLAVTTSLYKAFSETARFKPSSIQQEKVSQGMWGRKSGKGFYDYKKS